MLPLDAQHAQIARLLEASDACKDQCARDAKLAGIRRLGAYHGEPIALVSFSYDPHICGNVNCPYWVVTFGKAGARTLLRTDGYAVAVDERNPLPRIRVTSHDSADTSYEAQFSWENGAYVRTSLMRINLATGERREADVPIRFAPGVSSSAASGRLTSYWNATYLVDGRIGQRLVVSNVRCSERLLILLLAPNGDTVSDSVGPGRPYRLPATGTYELSFALNAPENVTDDIPLTFTVTVR